jgi:AcrR family transcriptional regulator
MKALSMRHEPQQARSQRTVDLILDAAAGLIAEVGYEATTTNAIAERAAISIGSLYRYFSDKDAILRGLALRYLQQTRAIYDEVFTEDVVYLPLDVALDRMIDPFIELHFECPCYKQIFLEADTSTDIAAALEELDQEIVERIASFLLRIGTDISEERARLIATICKAEVKVLLALIVPESDEVFRAQVTAEMKRMLFSYLAQILGGECE